MNEIIIHCGLSKTGSSSIQKYFELNRDTLVELGLYYPPVIDNYNSGNIFVNSTNPDIEKMVSDIGQYLLDAKKKSCNKILLSSENISTIPKNYLEKFLLKLETIECKIKFIIIERDPYEWYFSSWLQSIKMMNNSNWIDASLLPDPDFSLHPLLTKNYLQKHNAFEILSFNYNDIKTSLVENVLKALELPIPEFQKEVYENRSLSAEEVFVSRLINRAFNFPFISKNILAKFKCNNDKKFFFVDKESLACINGFCNRNNLAISKFKFEDHEPSSYLDIRNSLSTESIAFLDLLEIICLNVYDYSKQASSQLVNIHADSYFKLLCPEDFDPQLYLLINTDLIKANVDPYEHYVNFGSIEKRRYK
jgi:hypothetical protein